MEIRMNAELRKSTSIKMKPSIVRKARVRAASSDKRLGEWIEEAIDEKIERRKEAKIGKTCGNRSLLRKYGAVVGKPPLSL